MYCRTNFISVLLVVDLVQAMVTNLENRSTATNRYFLFPFSSLIAPLKSNCISSFGSEHFGSGLNLFLGIMVLRFLPIAVHALHFEQRYTTSRWNLGH